MQVRQSGLQPQSLGREPFGAGGLTSAALHLRWFTSKAASLSSARFIAPPASAGCFLVRADAEPAQVATTDLPVPALLDNRCVAARQRQTLSASARPCTC